LTPLLSFSSTPTPPPELPTLSLHDALPISPAARRRHTRGTPGSAPPERAGSATATDAGPGPGTSPAAGPASTSRRGWPPQPATWPPAVRRNGPTPDAGRPGAGAKPPADPGRARAPGRPGRQSGTDHGRPPSSQGTDPRHLLGNDVEPDAVEPAVLRDLKVRARRAGIDPATLVLPDQRAPQLKVPDQVRVGVWADDGHHHADHG